MEKELLVFPTTAEAFVDSPHFAVLKALRQVYQPISLPPDLNTNILVRTQYFSKEIDEYHWRALVVLSKWNEHRQEEELLDVAEGKKMTQTQRAALEKKKVIPDEKAFNLIQRVYPTHKQEAVELASDCCNRLERSLKVSTTSTPNHDA